MRLEGLVNV